MSSRGIIDDSSQLVVNVVELEDGVEFNPGNGMTLGPVGGNIGDTWDGSQYVSPAPPLPPPPPPPPPVTIETIQSERAVRLQSGFSYDFGDARGVHHIGMTEADMIGWRDVIDYANALIDSGDTTTLISIVTDTGAAQVTAPEWQAVMLQAAVIRQTIWAKSFALQSMDPIPSDYANDSHWT